MMITNENLIGPLKLKDTVEPLTPLIKRLLKDHYRSKITMTFKPMISRRKPLYTT